jgi:alpha-tubulin suppressor-like RCC1 family protein
MGLGTRLALERPFAMRWVLLFVALSSAGCTIDDIPFRCGRDDQCVDHGKHGQCEVSGYCSFPDDGCDSKRRYGILSPSELADRCVPRCVDKLALGGQFSCALRVDGKTSCWGDAENGQLGNGKSSEASHPTPIEVPAIGAAVDLAAGGVHACAINQASGNVWCWGNNKSKQLGSTDDTATGPLEILQKGPNAGEPSVQVTAGGLHSCARGSYGIECWGNDLQGQLGIPTGIPLTAVATPTRVDAQGFTIPSVKTEAVVAGGLHSCARLPNDQLWCWGSNSDGQLGEPAGNPKYELTPVQMTIVGGPANDVALGLAFTCARVGISVRCWGGNAAGQLGNPAGAQPTIVALDGQPTEICAGQAHACALLDDGRAQCWGNDDSGQLGLEGKPPKSPPAIVDLGVAISHIYCGYTHTCALTENDRVYCWGDNEHGELGNGESGDTTAHPEPDRAVTAALCQDL